MKLLTRTNALKKKTMRRVNQMIKRKRKEKATEKEIKRRKSMGKGLQEKSEVRKRSLTSMVTRLSPSIIAICTSLVFQNVLRKML